jgi:hypothetical protein
MIRLPSAKWSFSRYAKSAAFVKRPLTPSRKTRFQQNTEPAPVVWTDFRER